MTFEERLRQNFRGTLRFGEPMSSHTTLRIGGPADVWAVPVDAADLQAFRTASIRGIGRGGRSSQILHTGFAGPDHPQLPQLAESGYLKALFFRLDGA